MGRRQHSSLFANAAKRTFLARNVAAKRYGSEADSTCISQGCGYVFYTTFEHVFACIYMHLRVVMRIHAYLHVF